MSAALNTGEADLRWWDETRNLIELAGGGDLVSADADVDAGAAGSPQMAKGAFAFFRTRTTSPFGAISWSQGSAGRVLEESMAGLLTG